MNAAEVLGAYADVPAPTAVVFTRALTQIPGVWAEYLVDGNTLKFHFWPAEGSSEYGTGVFPGNFRDRLVALADGFPANNVEGDYVPDVGSWYFALHNMPVSPTPELAESVLRRMNR